MRIYAAISLALSAAVGAAAANVKGQIRPNDILKDFTPRELSQATRVVIDGGRWSARVAKGGVWEIEGVEEGEWVLDVLSPQYDFDQYLVRVTPGAPPTFHPHMPFSPLSSPSSDILLPSPLIVAPRASRAYVVKEDGFGNQIKGMLGNPTTLLMLATVVGVVGVPLLLKNIDPSAVEEASRRKDLLTRGDIGASLKGIMEQPGQRGPTEKPPAASSGRQKGKNRKR